LEIGGCGYAPVLEEDEGTIEEQEKKMKRGKDV